jgi:hypothetical protein
MRGGQGEAGEPLPGQLRHDPPRGASRTILPPPGRSADPPRSCPRHRGSHGSPRSPRPSAPSSPPAPAAARPGPCRHWLVEGDVPGAPSPEPGQGEEPFFPPREGMGGAVGEAQEPEALQYGIDAAPDLRTGPAQVPGPEGQSSSTVMPTIWLSGCWKIIPPGGGSPANGPGFAVVSRRSSPPPAGNERALSWRTRWSCRSRWGRRGPPALPPGCEAQVGEDRRGLPVVGIAHLLEPDHPCPPQAALHLSADQGRGRDLQQIARKRGRDRWPPPWRESFGHRHQLEDPRP